MQIIEEVNEISLDQVSVTQHDDQWRVSTSCTYPDALHAFLTSEQCPEALSLRAAGGISVKDEPTARRLV